MKMWRWSKAAMSFRLRERSRPLPNTSPDMSPMPIIVIGAPRSGSRPISRRCRRADSHAPRAVIAKLLVVVAVLAARRERVAEPEAALDCDPIGDVGETRGALVGGDDEIRAVVVEHPDARRMHRAGVGEVVGEIEHRVHQRLVRLDAVARVRLMTRRAA